MLATTGSLQKVDASRCAGSAVQEISDAALIEAIAKGDRGAMRVLYGRYNVRVYRYVLRLTGDAPAAEDVVSEVFIDVWRQAERFKSQSKVSTWLLGIARHMALSLLRRRADEALDDRMAATIEDSADDPETIVHNENLGAAVRTCLGQLSAAHREVLDLAYYHEKSVDEVARIVGIPASTVKTRMFYARKRMQTLLGAAGCNGH